MKAATAEKAVGDLGNVLAPSDLRQDFQHALTDTKNLVSVVYGAGKVVAAVAWRPQKKGLQVIAAAGTNARITHLKTALLEGALDLICAVECQPRILSNSSRPFVFFARAFCFFTRGAISDRGWASYFKTPLEPRLFRVSSG